MTTSVHVSHLRQENIPTFKSPQQPKPSFCDN